MDGSKDGIGEDCLRSLTTPFCPVLEQQTNSAKSNVDNSIFLFIKSEAIVDNLVDEFYTLAMIQMQAINARYLRAVNPTLCQNNYKPEGIPF